MISERLVVIWQVLGSVSVADPLLFVLDDAGAHSGLVGCALTIRELLKVP